MMFSWWWENTFYALPLSLAIIVVEKLRVDIYTKYRVLTTAQFKGWKSNLKYGHLFCFYRVAPIDTSVRGKMLLLCGSRVIYSICNCIHMKPFLSIPNAEKGPFSFRSIFNKYLWAHIIKFFHLLQFVPIFKLLRRKLPLSNWRFSPQVTLNTLGRTCE